MRDIEYDVTGNGRKRWTTPIHKLNFKWHLLGTSERCGRPHPWA